MEKKIIDSIIKAAKELGAREVDLTGGEPLLEIGKVKEILLSAKKYDLWTNVTTNGFYLQDNLKNLKKWGLKELHIHIPSLDSKKYSSIMKGNSNLSRVLDALKNSVGLFQKVMVNIPIEKGLNDNEIPRFIEYFGSIGATPRFIESMSTKGYVALNKETIEKLARKKLGKVKKTGKYLWGINKYSVSDHKFETLRCICFDKKCKVCYKTNFIHIDKDYRIRPCNLRDYRIEINKNNIKEALITASEFLIKQTNVPEEYQKIWEKQIL